MSMAAMFAMIRVNISGGRFVRIGMHFGMLGMRVAFSSHVGCALDAHTKQRDQQQMAKKQSHISS